MAIRQLVPPKGLQVRLGRFLHRATKKWEWRLNSEERYLLRYQKGSMGVYVPAGNTLRRWKQEEIGRKEEIMGRPCSVRQCFNGTVAITSEAQLPQTMAPSGTILDVLSEWGNVWVWKTLRLIGDDNWLLMAIREGTVIAVTDGSYIKEMYPNMCSCTFILECNKGRGRIFGAFPEQSGKVCMYQGELLDLMAIHLILLAANKVDAKLTGLVQIFSDCLGALGQVTSLPESQLPSGCSHSDVLKTL